MEAEAGLGKVVAEAAAAARWVRPPAAMVAEEAEGSSASASEMQKLVIFASTSSIGDAHGVFCYSSVS